jgi:prevent-host-death family protein
MTRLAASKVREEFSETLNRVVYKHERIVLRRRGKDVAVIVPFDDLAVIEKVEDELDAREARRILADMKRRRQRPIPYERIRRELGLK